MAAGARSDGSVLFDGARVGAGAGCQRSVMGRGARIGERRGLDGAVIGEDGAHGQRERTACRHAGMARGGTGTDVGPILHGRVSAGQPRRSRRGRGPRPAQLPRRQYPADVASPGAAGEWRAPFVLDVARTLGVHPRGRGDPAYRVRPTARVWRTSLTPAGPATLRVQVLAVPTPASTVGVSASARTAGLPAARSGDRGAAGSPPRANTAR